MISGDLTKSSICKTIVSGTERFLAFSAIIVFLFDYCMFLYFYVDFNVGS